MLQPLGKSATGAERGGMILELPVFLAGKSTQSGFPFSDAWAAIHIPYWAFLRYR